MTVRSFLKLSAPSLHFKKAKSGTKDRDKNTELHFYPQVNLSAVSLRNELLTMLTTNSYSVKTVHFCAKTKLCWSELNITFDQIKKQLLLLKQINMRLRQKHFW